MRCMRTLILFIILTYNYEKCYSRVVVNRFTEDDECALSSELKREISSYKNVTKQIMDNIINTSGKKMYQNYVHFIDKFGSRFSGSENLERAIDYMIDLTKANGLDCVTTEKVDTPHWVRGKETCKMTCPREKNIGILGLGPSVPTPSEGLTAEAVVVKSFDELEKATNVQGKIVVFNPEFVSYGETVKYRSMGATKASQKGAVASLIRSITPYSQYTLHTGAQFYSDNVTKIPTASITVEDANLLERLQKDGEKIILKIKMASTLDMKKSRNTLIDLKGKEKPNKMVIVSGHIDSWDVGSGAMDDGGGMFISWFAPIILKKLGLKPRRTLRAILWTAEEVGLVGAYSYLNRHIDKLDDINFIMESDEGTFRPLGLEVGGSKQAKCIIAEILKLFTPIDKLSESSAPGSDITVLTGKGVPGASLTNANDRYFYYHHTEADTLDVQNEADVIKCAAFWAAVSYVIADLSEDIPRETSTQELGNISVVYRFDSSVKLI